MLRSSIREPNLILIIINLKFIIVEKSLLLEFSLREVQFYRRVFLWRKRRDNAFARILKKGDEMGRFKLGSTVICAFGKGVLEFNAQAGPGTVTRLGENYATLTHDQD